MQSISPVLKWIVSLRLFSLPFILLPYALGILISIKIDGSGIDMRMVFIGFIPMLFVHLAGNLQSDIYDFIRGIDVVPNRFSGGIVRKWITVRQATRVVVMLYVISFLIGIFLIFEYGVIFLPFMIFGLLFGLFYSANSNYALKYNVTGEWFIFFGFGIIIPAYGYFINTGHFSIIPVLISLPAAFLIAAVKHANNWIAAVTPGNLEKNTSAWILGPKASRYYYYCLIILPYLIMGGLIYWKETFDITIPTSMLITYISLPLFVVLFKHTAKAEAVNYKRWSFGLDSMTALLYTLYMFLCCTAMFLV